MKRTLFILTFLLGYFSTYSQENCSNGIDDDNDGLIDLLDNECDCNSSNSSLLINPSFEQNSGCPSTFQQLNLVNNWVSGNGESIDYMNTCNFQRYNNINVPDGDGYVGCYYLEDRLRYIGQCIAPSLNSGVNHTLIFEISALFINNSGNNLDNNVGGLCEFSYNSIPYPVEVVLYGSDLCGDLPWGGTGSPIGNGNWVELGRVTYQPTDTNWNDLTINFTPLTNISAIAIGPPQNQNPNFPIYAQGGNGNIGCFPFIQYDNFILNESSLINDIEITSTGNYCANDLTLNASSQNTGGNWQWFKNGIAIIGETSSSLSISSNSYGIGSFTAVYSISGNCFSDDFIVKEPSPLSIDFLNSSSCMENIVAFTDVSFTGNQNITNWSWTFGDGNTSSEKDPTNVYVANGTYDVKLVITTDFGCKDSITKQFTLNRAPLIIDSCECSGFGVSLIPNHSFEDNTCCGGISRLDCADTWIQASSATSDYYNCGNPSIGGVSSTTDGTGFVGYIVNGPGYLEYIGACLISPMTQGSNYKLELQLNTSSTTELAIWGTTVCTDLPFNGNNCPQGIGNWTLLGVQTVASNGSWVTAQLNITPSQDINAVVLGGNCNTSSQYVHLDDLNLSSSILQPVSISGNYCTNDVILSSSANIDTLDFKYQWFKDGLELIGETDTILDVSGNNYGPGEYKIMGIYRDACDVSDPIIVDSLFIDFNTQSIPTCSNLDSGKIEVRNIIGNGISTPYEFFIDGNGPFPDSNFSNLSAGTYQIVIIDSNLCTDTTDVLVDSIPTPIANFSFDTVCIGNTTIFSDNSQVSGGIIDEWTWSIDGTIDINQNTGYTFSSLGPHDAELKVTSSNGCVDSISKEIVLHDLPLVDFQAQPGCQFSAIQFTNTTSTSGQPFNSSYIFNWSFDDGSSSTDDNPTHSYNSASIYNITLTAVSDDFCVNDTTKQLTIHPKPTTDFTSDSVCIGQITSFIDLSSVSTGSINGWQWSIEALISSIQNPTYTFSNDGSFSVQLISISDQGCEDTIQKNVTVHSLPIANFTSNTNEVDVVNNRVEFYNSSSGAINYLWLFDSIGQSSQANPTFDFRIDVPCQNFENKLFAETEFGCIDSITKVINSKGNLLFYVPNSFTPDNDGVNDIFKPVFTDLSDNDYSFQVFDRWGTIVFETNNINSGWDGTHKGVLLKQDSYIWKINSKTVCEIDLDKFKGHITLIR